MANKYIKILNDNAIRSDLLREFLYKELHNQCLVQIKSEVDKLCNQITVLNQLFEKLKDETNKTQKEKR